MTEKRREKKYEEATDFPTTEQEDKKTQRNRRRRQKKLLNYQYDIKSVSPKTENQKFLFDSFDEDKHIVLHGAAGSGKSFCALFLALTSLFEGHYDRIVLFRSIVPTRDIGFLPGTIAEKVQMYEEPYSEIVDDLLGKKSAYNDLKRDGLLEFKSTSFLRGMTYTNTLLILDEAQNCTWHELCSLVTRVGEGSKLIILGDSDQNDLAQYKRSEQSGLENLIKVCQNMTQMQVIRFDVCDILRSDFVREFLTVKHSLKL